jgi:pimeloyl-ACP methyl ester carboxylesterase
VLGPVALAALFLRRKKKPGKVDALVVVAALALGMGAGLAACGDGGGTSTPTWLPPTLPPTGTCTPAVTPGPTETPIPHTPTPGLKGVVALFCGSFGGGTLRRPATCSYTGHLTRYQEWADKRGYTAKYFDYPGYGSFYFDYLPDYDPGYGKPGQATKSVDYIQAMYGTAPTVYIGFSAGGDSAMLAALQAKQRGLSVEAVVAIDPAFASYDYSNTGTQFDNASYQGFIAELVNAKIPVYVLDAMYLDDGLTEDALTIGLSNPYFKFDQRSNVLHMASETDDNIFNDIYSWVYSPHE